MSWLQLRLDTEPAAAAALEDALLAAGAVAVTLEDNADEPVLEPGVGINVKGTLLTEVRHGVKEALWGGLGGWSPPSKAPL